MEIMMRDPEQTIGNLIDKQSVAFIASVDGDGFPNMKAMLPPRKREGIRSRLTQKTSEVKCMAVSYNKLWKILIDKKMNKSDLKKAAGVSWGAVTKMSKDEKVSMISSLKYVQPSTAMWGI
jgi:general stress protein 26